MKDNTTTDAGLVLDLSDPADLEIHRELDHHPSNVADLLRVVETAYIQSLDDLAEVGVGGRCRSCRSDILLITPAGTPGVAEILAAVSRLKPETMVVAGLSIVIPPRARVVDGRLEL
jgi:hypothetical protein